MDFSSILFEILGKSIHQFIGKLDLCFQGLWLSEENKHHGKYGVKSSIPRKLLYI